MQAEVGDSEPVEATSERTDNRTTTDTAFLHHQTNVMSCSQIPNINRPRRALYTCHVGTDQNIIPCNMRGETRIQEKDLHELTKPEHDSKDRKTQNDQEPTASKSRKGHTNRHSRRTTRSNRRKKNHP